jgi:hypothetical protein
VSVRSGIHANPGPVEGVVWREFVTLPPGTPWLRLYFSRIWLGKDSYLRIVAVRDGSLQTMQMEHVEQWQYSSAYFNGESVMLELVAGPGTLKNYVEIDKVMAGDAVAPAVPDWICGTTDDRVLSSHPAVGRIDPVGCTGWIIDYPWTGTNKLHLSAGHCESNGVLEFDVPASAANCAIQHPPASKQFAIDRATAIWANGGGGNDYWIFRCFPNSTTGLTTYQTQGAAFMLSAAIPGVGTTLRNYGYGMDGTNWNNATGNSCDCSAPTGSRNAVQQTLTGPLHSTSGTRVNYVIDTCGGSSGSVVLEQLLELGRLQLRHLGAAPEPDHHDLGDDGRHDRLCVQRRVHDGAAGRRRRERAVLERGRDGLGAGLAVRRSRPGPRHLVPLRGDVLGPDDVRHLLGCAHVRHRARAVRRQLRQPRLARLQRRRLRQRLVGRCEPRRRQRLLRARRRLQRRAGHVRPDGHLVQRLRRVCRSRAAAARPQRAVRQPRGDDVAAGLVVRVGGPRPVVQLPGAAGRGRDVHDLQPGDQLRHRDRRLVRQLRRADVARLQRRRPVLCVG